VIASRALLGLVVGVSTAGVATGIGVLATTPRGSEPVGLRSERVGSSALASPAGPYPRPPAVQDPNAPYDGQYHFARIRFSPGGRGSFGGFGRGRGRGGAMWAHDYPRADFNFLAILRETTFVRTHRAASNVVTFDDPEFFRYPISYIVEVGAWNPTDEETVALGEYLLKGGFLIVDDFRGPYELDNLAFHLKRALPDHSLLPVAEDDDIFDSFFRIAPNDVVPPYGGYPPLWYGIYEENDPEKRIMVMINANNDMAEYWEFSDYGYYPIDLANEAYKLGVNYVVYALTH
jgi:hypothetical protein